MGVNLSGQIPKDPASDNILDRLSSEAGGLGQAIGGALNGMITGIGDAIRGVFEPGGVFSPIGEAAREITDGQTHLQDRMDLISALLDYGSAYIPEGRHLNGALTLPFTQQLGPMRGVRLKGNGIELLSPGLWDIRALVTRSFALTLAVNGMRTDVLVKRPDGSTYSIQSHKNHNSEVSTATVITSVVVPEPGYYVEVYSYGVIGRGVVGGPRWSRLTVQRISDETNGNWNMGSESSDPDPKG